MGTPFHFSAVGDAALYFIISWVKLIRKYTPKLPIIMLFTTLFIYVAKCTPKMNSIPNTSECLHIVINCIKSLKVIVHAPETSCYKYMVVSVHYIFSIKHYYQNDDFVLLIIFISFSTHNYEFIPKKMDLSIISNS